MIEKPTSDIDVIKNVELLNKIRSLTDEQLIEIGTFAIAQDPSIMFKLLPNFEKENGMSYSTYLVASEIVRDNGKIDAIKFVRNKMGLDLKRSKELVERLFYND